MTNYWMMPLSVLLLLSITANTEPVNCSMAMLESPPFIDLAEQADLILIGKVIDIEIREISTITGFQVSEYIKEKNTSPEFTLKLAGGTNLVTSPSSPTFELDKEYLLFLMDKNLINTMNDDKFYSLLFDHYGKLRMSDVDIESLNNIREAYGSTIVGDDSKWVIQVLAGSLISVLLLFILHIRRRIFN